MPSRIKGLGEIALRARDLEGLAISRDDPAPERERLERLGLTVTEASHEWAHWRSLYVNDPDGDVVEWVCFDPAVITASIMSIY